MTFTPLRFGFVSACMMLAIVTVLGAATLLDLFDGPGSPREERIARTPDAPLSPGAMKRFVADVRFYLARRYALKEQFKEVQSLALLRLFGRSASPQVMVGQDGFLFLDNAAALSASHGAARPSPEDIAAWEAFFPMLETDLSANFVLLLAPNKHTAYADKLPAWAANTPPVGPVRRESVLQAAEGHVTAPDLAALFAAQRASDPDAPLYHQTDSHWTEWGASLAAEAALGQIDKAWGEETRPGGDQARLLSLSHRMPQTMPVITGPDPVTCETLAGRTFEPVIFDPLPEYRFTCRSAGGTGRAVVFMDSFGMSTVPSLARHFAETHFVWELAVNKALIDELTPDTVILVMVERQLMQQTPARLLSARIK